MEEKIKTFFLYLGQFVKIVLRKQFLGIFAQENVAKMSNNIPQNVDYINTTFNLPNIWAKRIWLITETNWLPRDRRMLPLQVKKIGNSWRNNLLREKVKRRGGKQLFAFPALIAKFRYSWVRKPNQFNYFFLMWEKQLMNNSEDEPGPK